MKAIKLIFGLALVVLLLQACNRSMTPYEAANNPRGKKCRSIR